MAVYVIIADREIEKETHIQHPRILEKRNTPVIIKTAYDKYAWDEIWRAIGGK